MTGSANGRASYGAMWMMAAAIIFIGFGTVLTQLDVSTAFVIVALAAAGAAVLTPNLGVMRMLRRRSVLMVIVVGVALQAFAFATQSTLPSPLRLALLALAALGIHALLAGGARRTAEMAVVVVGHFVLMAVMLTVSGPPDIDVYDFQQEASAALLRGENPFGLRFLNTAGPDSPYYAPEVIDGDRLKFGFIYPPLSLLLALPGYAIAGDYRYAALAALSISAGLIVLMHPGQLAAGAALLVLFAPVTQFVLYWGWTDPFVILLLSITVFLAIRKASTTPMALGLLIASKQYVAPLLVLGVVLLRDVRRRVGWPAMVAIPVAVAAATVAPFVLWDAASFVYSTVTAHILQPFRIDSLSVPGVLARAGLGSLPGWIGFALAGLVLVLVAWRAPRTPAGFCGGAAVVLMVFFLFGKQAFLHYYFLPLVALAIGLAIADAEPKASAVELERGAST
jgi:hypothetical protein